MTNGFGKPWRGEWSAIVLSVLLSPAIPNAYGPGVNSDATGQRFEYREPAQPRDPYLEVQPGTLGPDINLRNGTDQYGQPVEPDDGD